MAIFSLGQFLIGAGSCPLYSLGQAFIDESVSPKSLPIYIGVWFGSGLIGNGIGLLLGGVFSSIFVNGTPVCFSNCYFFYNAHEIYISLKS